MREVKLVGGIPDIESRAFMDCSAFEQIAIPTKAFDIENGANHNCRLLTSGTTTPMSLGQVVIASGCLKYMSVTGLAEGSNRINAITNSREQTTKEILGRIRVLFV